jgi:serine/threonine protein kinase
MCDVIRKHKHVIPSNFKKLVDQKIERRYSSTAKYFNENIGLTKNGLSLENQTKGNSKTGLLHQKHKSDKSQFYSLSDQKNIFMKLVNEYNKDKLIENFTKPNGYVYKWDVFSLGLVFVKIVKSLNIVDKECYDLINHMIDIDYTERYTAIQCLAHPFFSKYSTHTKRKNRSYITNKNQTKSKRTSQLKKIQKNKAVLQYLHNNN